MNTTHPSRRLSATLLAFVPPLAAAQHVIEEVHVVGVPIEQSAADLAQSVTVIRDETLDRIRAANLGETLSSQLGISASSFGAGASRPIIRGLAGARVRTMEDGIGSMDVSTISDDHAVGIDPIVAEQIEIFRGPTTLLYGSGAVGGVVNTVTNRIPEIAPDDGVEGRLELRGDTAADERGGAFNLNGGGARFGWHLDANTRDADDYEIPGFADADHDPAAEPDEVPGFLENSHMTLDSAAAGGSWLGDRGMTGVAISRFRTNYGVPGHVHTHEDEEHEDDEEAHDEDHDEEAPVRIDLAQTRIDVKSEWSGLTGFFDAINFRLGTNDYEHVELEGNETATRFTNEAYEARVELLHRPLGAWRGAFGVQLDEREFAAIGDEAFIPPVDTTSTGLFLIEQRDVARWSLGIGARWETQEQSPSNGLPSIDDDAVSLSVSGIRSIGDDYSFALHFAHAERLPDAEERYAAGPHLASGIVEVGDPNLGIETSRHVDIGFRKNAGDLTLSVTAFATDYDDFVYLRDTGAEDPDAELPIFAYAQQDARFTGLEAEIFTPIASIGDRGEIDLRVFGDYVRGELADGSYVPRMPPLRVGARIQYHDDRFVAGLEASRYAEQDETAEHETPTAGYTMINADLSWQLARERGPGVELFVRASNLADEEARRHTSLVKDVAPLPGRNFRLGARMSF